MKKLALIMLAVVSMALVSCGGGGKTITPTTTKFQSGDLKRIVEVVDQPCTIAKVNKPKEQIELKVKLKLVNDKYEGWNPQDIGFYRLLSILTVDLEDENGTVIGDADLREGDSRRLKEFLTKAEDSTEDFVFVCHADWQVELSENDFIKSIVHFTPHLSADPGRVD